MREDVQAIMIVDDEPSLLRMMELYLTRLGYRVVSFDSTEKAWEHAQADPAAFRLAVLDMTMAGLSSRELAERLLAVNPEAEVIFASGYPINLADFERTAPGRTSFLHKPFVPQTLASRVRDKLG
jgi:DNA-binding NtrC family response regulator